MEPQSLLKEVLIQLLLNCRELKKKTPPFTWSNEAFSNHDIFVQLLALCLFYLILLFSAWVSKNHISHSVSWFKVFNSNHHLKPGFLVLPGLHTHRNRSFGQLPVGRDQNFHCYAGSADGWYFLTGLQRTWFWGENPNPVGPCECEPVRRDAV